MLPRIRFGGIIGDPYAHRWVMVVNGIGAGMLHRVRKVAVFSHSARRRFVIVEGIIDRKHNEKFFCQRPINDIIYVSRFRIMRKSWEKKSGYDKRVAMWFSAGPNGWIAHLRR
jgi:hypothetical protein